jgi:hypothetical protein
LSGFHGAAAAAALMLVMQARMMTKHRVNEAGEHIGLCVLFSVKL